MSDEQIARQIEIIKKATKDASRSKETAIKFLTDAGIPKNDDLKHAKKKK